MRKGYREGKNKVCANCEHATEIKAVTGAWLCTMVADGCVHDSVTITTIPVFPLHTCDDWSKNEPMS